MQHSKSEQLNAFEYLTAHTLLMRKRLRDAKALLYFSGWARPMTQQSYVGSLLWFGKVTFNSGRVLIIPYQVQAVAQDLDELEGSFNRARVTAENLMDYGAQGWLMNYYLNQRRARRIAHVEWHHWKDADATRLH